MKLRRIALRILVGLAIIWLLTAFHPVRNGFFRTGLVGSLLGSGVCLLLVMWSLKLLRRIFITITAVVVAMFLIPGREPDADALRAAYVRALQRYEGTKYVWGGEGWRGVDCSGLVRSAMVDAHLLEAARTFNPTLARRAMWLWWNDASAGDFMDGKHGLTVNVGTVAPLGQLDLSPLQPGDLAVTTDGSHMLAYVGDAKWIEADPYTLRVMVIEPATSQWGITRVQPSRWVYLNRK